MFGTSGSYQKWADVVNDDSYTFDGFSPYLHRPINFTPPVSSRFPNSTAHHASDLLNDTDGPLQVTFGAFAWPWSSWVKKALSQVGRHVYLLRVVQKAPAKAIDPRDYRPESAVF